MCTVSMVMDHYREIWQPQIVPIVFPQTAPTITIPPAISAKEIAEFRKLLERAREYDKRMHEPDCELDEKKEALKKIAAALGIDISFVDEPPAADAVDPSAADTGKPTTRV